MAQPTFETLQIYQFAEMLAGEVWGVVVKWGTFARDTIGKQLVRAADSIGANIAEGYGRGSYVDKRRFLYIARGSLNETICWLKRAEDRRLLTGEQRQSFSAITAELGPRLNAYLNFIIKQIKKKATPNQSPE